MIAPFPRIFVCVFSYYFVLIFQSIRCYNCMLDNRLFVRSSINEEANEKLFWSQTVFFVWFLLFMCFWIRYLKTVAPQNTKKEHFFVWWSSNEWDMFGQHNMIISCGFLFVWWYKYCGNWQLWMEPQQHGKKRANTIAVERDEWSEFWKNIFRTLSGSWTPQRSGIMQWMGIESLEILF